MSPLPFAALLLGGGLRLDVPQGAPTQGGLEIEARWAVLPDAWIGAAASWAGGVNDNNPNRKLIAQRIEAVALLGGDLALRPDLRLGLQARAGLIAVFGWPRGFLTNLDGRLAPWLGGELRLDWRLAGDWWLSPRLGLGWLKLIDHRAVPTAGLHLWAPWGGP